MYQPRAGNAGTSIANTVAVTPWNMNPTPIHMASVHGGAVVEVAEGEVAQHDRQCAGDEKRHATARGHTHSERSDGLSDP